MKVMVNGKNRKIEGDTTLFQLLSDTFSRPGGIITVRNDQIVEQKELKKTPVREHDRIEFLQIVGGG